MQTFLPHPDFAETARVLDRQRLGKQRVETLQILLALTTGTSGWSRHPAVVMWRGYEVALARYGDAVCAEWIARGYRDTCRDKIDALAPRTYLTMPPWLGDAALHASHRSNLLRKLPAHYTRFGWSEPSTLPYVWPSHH